MTERIPTPKGEVPRWMARFDRIRDELAPGFQEVLDKAISEMQVDLHASAPSETGATVLATEKGLTPTGQHIADCERDAARYRSIREHGIPCSQADDCGSCTGEELDAQIDDAIAHPEKYDV